MNFMKKLVFILSFLFTLPSFSQRDSVYIKTSIYSCVYSEVLQQPKRVWYTVQCPNGSYPRKGMDFYTNDSVKTSDGKDYENNVWDKGHCAPAALDTLNELSAALGNDANFATTVTNSLASKVPNTRTLTINGTTYDLSANRSWTVSSDLQSAVNTSKVTTPVNPGANVVASFSVASYDGATFNYVLKDGTNFRAGTVVAVWNGATVQYNETTTNDIGNTTSVVLSVAISAGNAELIATSGTPGWTMKVVPIGI